MSSQDVLVSYPGRVKIEEHEAFFRQLLGDVDEPTAPFGLLEVRVDGDWIDEARLDVDIALGRRLRANARRMSVSPATLFHLAWAQVLARTSGREDVVFGTVRFGRMQGDTSSDRGRFINTLPMRIAIGEESVEASVRRTHSLLAELLRHEHASLALVQRCSAVPPPTPLFSAVLNYRHSHGKTTQTWEGIHRTGAEERTKYPFTLSVQDLEESFGLTAQAPASVGALRMCRFMQTALASLVEALETLPSAALRTLEVLPEEERHQLLYGWNDTRTSYPADKCIHELFEEQVRKSPNTVAVVYEDNQLSYGELNRRANRLAHYLRELGVQPDTRVAICVDRSFEMIVAVLAVLKAGGAYVPLDPAYPVERLQFMLEDSGPLALLTQCHLKGLSSTLGATLPVLYLDARTAAWNKYPDVDPNRNSIGLSPKHLAYVIYTSGSTGAPKGVLVEHSGLCNLAFAQIRIFGVEPDSRVLQFASFSFDACVSEIMMTLCRGAALYFAPQIEVLAGEFLDRVVAHYGITHATLPPAVLAGMPEEIQLNSIRTMILAGEALAEPLAKRWASGRRLINAYGPTESTVCATAYEYNAMKAGSPPIGGPIANLSVYVLDGRGQPVPIGANGELYIGGVGVARGYLNREQLTQDKFVPDTFSSGPGARMYRTGDLGRWRPDGNIEFLGRNDFQVKIRGFRIELGEIEARLTEHPDVREALVIASEPTPGDKRLIAYYIPADIGHPTQHAPTAEELRSHVCARLPEYMAPAAYVRLHSLPLTVNGKVDRKALPLPGSDAYTSRDYQQPAGETEIALAKLWADLLKLERVGRHDSFFELGGHSLVAVRMMARVGASFGKHVALASFIQTPTVAALAHLLSGDAVSPMAVLNKGSAKKIPLIWVAPESWQPRLTSYLSAEQPVLSFVLTQEELAATVPHYRLEDLAARMVKKIRQLHPKSSYVLAGFCQSSLLVYECAQQMRQLGYDIPLLVMGDALPPGYLDRLSFAERSKRRLEREAFYLSVISNTPASEWKKLLKLRVGAFKEMREQGRWQRIYRSDRKYTRPVRELYQAFIVAQLDYVPSPYPGRVLFLQSGERPRGSRQDAVASWGELINELEVFESPGDHTNIFEEPHVRVAANRIQLALDNAADGVTCPSPMRSRLEQKEILLPPPEEPWPRAAF
jgi:amino acid adenylation domain-containing protein